MILYFPIRLIVASNYNGVLMRGFDRFPIIMIKNPQSTINLVIVSFYISWNVNYWRTPQEGVTWTHALYDTGDAHPPGHHVASSEFQTQGTSCRWCMPLFHVFCFVCINDVFVLVVDIFRLCIWSYRFPYARLLLTSSWHLLHVLRYIRHYCCYLIKHSHISCIFQLI